MILYITLLISDIILIWLSLKLFVKLFKFRRRLIKDTEVIKWNDASEGLRTLRERKMSEPHSIYGYPIAYLIDDLIMIMSLIVIAIISLSGQALDFIRVIFH